MATAEILKYCDLLVQSNKDITPHEMLYKLHLSGYSKIDSAQAVVHFFPKLTADDMCKMLIDEYKQPLIAKNELISVLLACGFFQSAVDNAVNRYYPVNLQEYAVQIKSGTGLLAPSNNAYSFSKGDFTVEAWVKPQTCGTVLSRKGSEGGSGNGGFLLVLKPDGVWKLATDDGFGFYEINSQPVNVYDRNWHHILGCRHNGELSLYFDFKKLKVTPRTNRFSNLDVSNGRRLMLGMTDQYQEVYNYYVGLIGEVRLWSIAKMYANIDEWKSIDWINQAIVGMWNFRSKNGCDISHTANNLESIGNILFVEWQLHSD